MSELPKYPCIEMVAKTRGIDRDAKGEQVIFDEDNPRVSSIFIPVHSEDQLLHALQIRRSKGWAIVGAHNLDKPTLARRVPMSAALQAQIKREVDAVVVPVEVGASERVRAKKASA